MADITERITRKSLRAKKRAAIKTIKTQAREKIKEVKIQYAKNPERQQARIVERERDVRLDHCLDRIGIPPERTRAKRAQRLPGQVSNELAEMA